jgi:choline dehydrogenase
LSALQPSYDFIVVGSGTGGAVVAGRLAERSDADILLVEAGPDNAGIADIEAPAHWVKLFGGAYDWGYRYAPSPHVAGRAIPIPRGKVLGGSSSTNAMLWYRGHPSDYDNWAATGCTGWSFAECLPFFKRSEDWQGGETPYRGSGGPMRITRSADPHPIARAMLEGATELGLPVIDDPNGPSNEGAALSNLNVFAGRRWSVVDGYLRPNHSNRLAILSGSLALSLKLEQGRATTLLHQIGTETVETRARQGIVLALGAFDTPRLLMLSGIGNPRELQRLGIPTRHALSGVGQNLQDHPLLMGMNFRMDRPLGPVRDNGGGTMLNWKSAPGLQKPDLHAFVVQGRHAGPDIASDYDFSGHVFALSPGLMDSKSRGFLKLLSGEPMGPLEIQPNYLTERSDLQALMAAMDTIFDLADTAPYRALGTMPVAPKGRLSRADKERFVRQACDTFFHPCGTCAMGVGEDAVVDPRLKVHGLEGLTIADASVIPTIPTSNTQAPVVMIAERAADFLLNAA